NQMKEELQKTADAILTVSEITYNNALKKLEDTKIYSPIDGYVDFCDVKENNMIASGTPLFTISERENTLIEFSVSGIHVPSLSIGNKIRVTNRDEYFTATITEIPPMVDTSTGLFKITASLDDKDQNFVYGAGHFVEIPTEHTNDAMTVPFKCVYFEEDGAYVFVVKDSIAVKTPVETGIYNDKDVEIKSGIEPTDDIISTWSSRLFDGAKVNMVQQAETMENDDTSENAENMDVEE
ncbi:MAG: efflux RND transporter periplasmic adaptor subunit, partial [Oscillospiraceae bacterium]